MAVRVKLEEPCVLENVRYEKGDVVEVSERTAELNPWMKPTDDTKVTPADSRPTYEAFAAAEKLAAEKEEAAAKKAAEKAAEKNSN